MSDDTSAEIDSLVREIDLPDDMEPIDFVTSLIRQMDGQKNAQGAWGSYQVVLNYRGKGLDGVDITEHHSIKFRQKSK